ncbi:MAG: hypothetical protein ACOYM9_09190 [Bradymonadia bacterium]
MKLSLRVSALLALVTFVPACGAEDEKTASTAEGQDFLAAVPASDELALSIDEVEAGQALTVDGEMLDDGEAPLHRYGGKVVERVNEAVASARARVDALIADTEPEVYSEGNVTCRRWTVEEGENTWRFSSCERDRGARKYVFALSGKTNGAADDAYAPVFVGEGRVLPGTNAQGRRHAAGRVGFDFDALDALTGEARAMGQVGIGFRHVGPVRQLNVALRDFARGDDETPVSALYRYRRHVGVGGHVSLLAYGDVLTRADDGGLTYGEDGSDEALRIRIGWLKDQGARAAAIACGGTVGEGECARIVGCWARGGEARHEAIESDSGERPERPTRERLAERFPEGSCAAVADLEDAPSPDETAVEPAGAPDAVEEPGPDSDE